MRSASLARAGAAAGMVLLSLLVGAAPAHAQVGESIHQYASQITIEKSGDIRVVEQIVYDFGSNSKHGITRDIPTRFHYKNTRYDRLLPVSEVAVTASPGTPTQTNVSTDSAFTHIRIGDPDRTITGTCATRSRPSSTRSRASCTPTS